MDLRSRGVVGLLVLLAAVVALAGGNRAAMVIETRGDNLVIGVDPPKQVRTLQVLTEGMEVKVAEGAVLRLSFFQSGHKEKITGPCTVRLSRVASEKLTATGRVEVQSRRNASTELDKSTNLRRTGGAMQADAGIVPENSLAFSNDLEKNTVVGPQTKRSSSHGDSGGGNRPKPAIASLVPKLEFTGMSYAYLTPEEAQTLHWNHKDSVKLDLYRSEGPVFSVLTNGTSAAVPVDRLVPGELHWAVARGTQSATSQYFRILSEDEVREYRKLVETVESNSKGDPRSRYSELIYLNAQLGLLTRARVLALEALETYPDDQGLQALVDELNQRLRIRE